MYSTFLKFLTVVTLMSSSQQQEDIGNVTCDCIKAVRCKGWLAAVQKGKYLDLPVCGFDERSFAPLICCPRDAKWTNRPRRAVREIQNLEGLKNIQLSCTVTSPGLTASAKARQKCLEYSKLVFKNVYEVSVGESPFRPEQMDTCGRNDDEDTQGAEPREFPHMAMIGFSEEKLWQCGGSLISDRFILSVAHCASNRNMGPAMWAKLGDLDVSTDTDVAKPQIFKIVERIVHPEYKPPLKYHDIALFKLDKDVVFSQYVRPACLYTKRDPPDNQADATGWGRKNFGGKPSNILKKIKMTLLGMDECTKSYNRLSNRTFPQGLLDDSMICALETSPSGDLVCQGDSGAPLQIMLKDPYCMYGLIGITSFGQACGFQAPGINTKVYHYLHWIVENVWPEET